MADAATDGVPITAAMVRDAVVCERRAWHDLHTPAERAVDMPPLAGLLWEQGFANGEMMLAQLEGGTVVIEDHDREAHVRSTVRALTGPAAHVLGARVEHDGMVGLPTLVSRVDGVMCAGALGWGPLFGADGRPLWRLALPLAFEARLLLATGLGDGSRAFVIGADGVMRWYDLEREGDHEGGSIATVLDRQLRRVRQIVDGIATTRGEVAGRCRICPWREVCAAELRDDVTRVHGIDRALRRDVEQVAPTLGALSRLEPPAGDRIAGMEPHVFLRLRDRARLLVDAGEQAHSIRPPLRRSPREVFLHLEQDPTRGGLVFAHCFVVRQRGRPERVRSEVVGGADGERRMFRAVVAGIARELRRAARLLLTTPHARTALEALARRYPDVCAPGELSGLLSGGVVDLQADLIEPGTEWPLESYDVASVADWLGVGWRRGGALAEWDAYHRDGDDGRVAAVATVVEDACRTAAIVRDELLDLPVRRQRDRRDGAAGEPPSRSRQMPDDVVGGGVGPAAPRRRAAEEGPTATLYATPALRPCADIPVEGGIDEEGRRRPDRDHGRLLDKLPLAGSEAMRPTEAGGIALCERLRTSLPWMSEPIALIERQLRVAVWAGRPWLQWRPILMAGPPGIGKSHLAREIGRVAGVPSAQLDLGGMHDSAALVATSRGWSNHKPCWPAEMMVALGVGNPILTLDELDKSGGSSRNGRVKEALLGMLEPSTAKAYFDTCLMTAVDLSAVCWITTANDVDLIPAPLRSRLDVVHVARPDVEHLDIVVAGVLADTARRWGVPLSAMPELPPRALAVLREAFAHHRSIRRVSRHIVDLLAALVPVRREGAN